MSKVEETICKFVFSVAIFLLEVKFIQYEKRSKCVNMKSQVISEIYLENNDRNIDSQ